MTSKNPNFDRPNEGDYAKTLQALIVCMNKFGPGAAIKTVLAFKRRHASVQKLNRAMEL